MNGKRGLPLFINRENKLPVGAAMFLIAALLYLSSNRFHLFEPQLLPMTWIDRAVPFMPHSVWIYISEYIYFPLIYILCRDMENLNKYFYSFLGLQTVSVIIFWLWPTTFPRGDFPLPPDLDAATAFVFNSLRATDTPANCAPSLHVSSVYLSAIIFLDEQREKFPFFLIWGTAIAASTLPTKQHYIVDVVTGAMMAGFFWFIFHRWVPYRPVEGAASGDQAKR